MSIYPRISGRLGNTIDLNVTFYKNGVPTDPFAIRKVSIYRSAVQDENLVAEFLVLCPDDPNYPSPLSREAESGTEATGVFHLFWEVPSSGIPTPDIFFDVWSYIPTDPGGSGGTDLTSGCSELDDETLWQSCCNRFWLYPDGFFCDDGLANIKLGFEPTDIKLRQPEKRTIEIGITPLPLYDFDYNRIAPIIPMLNAKITIMTENCEVLVSDAPMSLGLRDGTFRSNPFVAKYLVDTTTFLKGSYKYRVTLDLPNGESRVSPDFVLQVS